MAVEADPNEVARMAQEAAEMAERAEQLLSQGRVEDAERVCRALLRAAPDHPTALMILSAVCLSAGRWDEAESLLARGSTVHPQVVGFHAALGQLRLQSNQPAQAVEPLENCVLLDPETRHHRVMLVALYQTRVFLTFNEASKQAMLACLADDTLTHASMHKAWLSLVRVDPEAADIFELFDGAETYTAFCERLAATPASLLAIWGYRLLQEGLARFLATDVAIERGLTFARRWFYERRDQLDGYLPMVCRLARYCFLTEYAFADHEDHGVLREHVSTPAAVALLACYEPLAAHPEAASFLRQSRQSRQSDEACYVGLVRTLLEEPLEEAELRSTIPTWTPVVDDVSRAVRSQYEENPYPRWTSVGSGASSQEARGRGKKILIAGCGTGSEAVDAALNFGAAEVDAIDLSRASLAYGARKAREMGIPNLRFAQADILDIGSVGRSYDLATAVGVLHHMREPRAGWRALLGVLRPGGVMRVALYSQMARAAVTDARALIDAARFPATPQGIRDFRAAVMDRPADDPLRVWMTRSYDFYSLSQCRDLVFHVEEHTFNLVQIAGIVRSLGLTVMRLDVPSPVYLTLYRERFRDDPTGTKLDNWHRLEQRNPSMFAGMYSLWLCRIADGALVDASWLQGAGNRHDSPSGVAALPAEHDQ